MGMAFKLIHQIFITFDGVDGAGNFPYITSP